MKTVPLAQRIFSQPTAPFCEKFVLAEIKSVLREKRIPFFEDRAGNLIAGVRRAQELRSRIIFMAHMDHPGFRVTTAGRRRPRESQVVQAHWFGGCDLKQLKGARVVIYNPISTAPTTQEIRRGSGKDRPELGRDFEEIRGTISKAARTSLYGGRVVKLTISLRRPAQVNEEAFGGFDFVPFQKVGDQIRTRAADDLAGVVIALGTLMDQRGKAAAIFTRAEEVGFVGCLAALEEGVLKPGMHLVSLEASRVLPQARFGEGPVLRIGDRSSLFDSGLSTQMWQTAERLAKRKRGFTYQRALMDGGSTEATAAKLYGVIASGLAVPLKNYHNIGAKRAAIEIISARDMEGARTFCAHLAKSFRPLDFDDELRIRIQKNYKLLKELL